MFNKITGNSSAYFPPEDHSPENSPERIKKVQAWNMPSSPPRASNRPPPSSSEFSDMPPRGVFFSPHNAHDFFDPDSVAGGGRDPKMNAQIQRNKMAAGLQQSYPDGLSSEKKKAVKSGIEFDISPGEGKKVYETYKTMLKESK